MIQETSGLTQNAPGAGADFGNIPSHTLTGTCFSSLPNILCGLRAPFSVLVVFAELFVKFGDNTAV